MKSTCKMMLNVLLVGMVWIVPDVALAHPHLLDVNKRALPLAE